MLEQVNDYLSGLKNERGLTDNTLDAYRRDLKQYIEFLNHEAGCMTWKNVTDVAVMKYLYWLKDKGSAPATLARKAASVRGLHQFLLRTHSAESDPSYAIEVPKVERPLPKILTVKQVEALLNAPDRKTPAGKRDRAMLEVLYGTGMRVSELIQLNVDDLQLSIGFLRCGGNKGSERIMPIGRWAQQALSQYINDGRAKMVAGNKEDALFLNRLGRRMTRQGFWKILKQHAQTAGIVGALSPETLRHSFAAHLLENGADLESVEEMMGRAELPAYHRYRRSPERRLKEVYARNHPRA
ncbi:tyrosine recombinase XerD [Sporolactobacillus sp. THM7-4]|nr:tyrosine recombinase XerD [Sporolactobacillus sp. THM7-4]